MRSGSPKPRAVRGIIAATVSLLFGFCSISAAAQTTNADILRRLAADCLSPVAAPYSSLTLHSDPLNPFLNQAVISQLRDSGKEVFLVMLPAVSDSLNRSPGDMSLTYFVQDARVGYEADGRRHVTRTIDLELSYLLVAPDSKVIADSTCTRRYDDRIRRADLDAIENETIPITQGERPKRGFLRRYAEPIVVAGATAVAVYLFFNVRSDADNSQ